MHKNLIFVVLALFCFACSSDDNPDSISMIDNTILPGIGIGALEFTDTGNDVLSIYGDVEDLTIVNDQFVLWYYDLGLGFQLEEIELPGLSLQEKFDMRFELVDYSKNIITMVILSPFEGKTEVNIGLGSSRDEVIAQYGEPDEITSLYESYDALNMFFGYNQSETVDRIDLFRD